MKTYEMFDDAGIRSPIFQIENTYIALGTIVRILSGVEGVTEVRRCGMFAWRCEIKVEFKYLGRPFIAWEPFGDNSRYRIGPADMVEGAEDVPPLDNPDDILNLENAFKNHLLWSVPKAIVAGVGLFVACLWISQLIGTDRYQFARLLALVSPCLAAFAIVILAPRWKVISGMSMSLWATAILYFCELVYEHFVTLRDNYGNLSLYVFTYAIVASLIGTVLGCVFLKLKQRKSI